MLILSRKVDQKIIVGDVVFVVTEIREKSVCIGIDAPKDVPIVRDELTNGVKRVDAR